MAIKKVKKYEYTPHDSTKFKVLDLLAKYPTGLRVKELLKYGKFSSDTLTNILKYLQNENFAVLGADKRWRITKGGGAFLTEKATEGKVQEAHIPVWYEEDDTISKQIDTGTIVLGITLPEEGINVVVKNILGRNIARAVSKEVRLFREEHNFKLGEIKGIKIVFNTQL